MVGAKSTQCCIIFGSFLQGEESTSRSAKQGAEKQKSGPIGEGAALRCNATLQAVAAPMKNVCLDAEGYAHTCTWDMVLMMGMLFNLVSSRLPCHIPACAAIHAW
jgi:hypothetical protein